MHHRGWVVALAHGHYTGCQPSKEACPTPANSTHPSSRSCLPPLSTHTTRMRQVLLGRYALAQPSTNSSIAY